MSGRYASDSDSDDYVYNDDDDWSSDDGRQASKSGKSYKCLQCHDKPEFSTAKELKYHKASSSEHNYCEPCDKDFGDYDDLIYHKMQSPLHIICLDCKKEFKSDGGLQVHRKQFHRKTEPVFCPNCKLKFPSASGLLQHVEADECEKGLNKAILDKKIAETQVALAESSLDDNASNVSGVGGSVKILNVFPAPSPKDGEEEKKTEFDLEIEAAKIGKETWNPNLKQFVCPEPKCKKKFKKEMSIMQHLQSGVHASKSFRCPACLNSFKSSSALVQHIESQSCGLHSHEAGKNIVEDLAGGW